MARMPSPFGHALAGVLTVWAADLLPGPRVSPATTQHAPRLDHASHGLAVTCAGLAAAPDLDLLFAGHRTITHSIGAVIVVGAAAAVIAVRLKRPILRIGVICAAAYASHLLLDWMAVDQTFPRGLQLLWPFSHRWYISDWNIFSPTERRHIFTGAVMQQNAITIAQEMAILGPFLAAAWLIRIKALARLPSEMPRGDHAPQ
jgi:membrane-bound metal-dependent hydrolase YbcI (DUF457 family)